MTLEEFVKLLENSDRLRILKDEKEVFVGWLALLVMHDEMFEEIRTCLLYTSDAADER